MINSFIYLFFFLSFFLSSFLSFFLSFFLYHVFIYLLYSLYLLYSFYSFTCLFICLFIKLFIIHGFVWKGGRGGGYPNSTQPWALLRSVLWKSCDLIHYLEVFITNDTHLKTCTTKYSFFCQGWGSSGLFIAFIE